MATSDAAREIAADIINGDIALETHTDEVVVARFSRGYLPLEHSPVTAVTSVTVDGTAVAAGDDDGFIARRFGIERKWPHVWPRGVKIVVTYTTGWTPGSEPQEVREAITMLETWVDSQPEIRAEKIEIGDEAVWLRADDEAGRPPPGVTSLLRRWVRPFA